MQLLDAAGRFRAAEVLTVQILAADLWRDPYPLLATLRHEAPIYQLPGENAYLVSTWDLVAEAAGRVDDFSNHFRYALYRHDDGRLGALWTGGQGPDVFAGTDPPEHTAHRRIFFPELTQARIAALEPYVASLTDSLLASLLADGHCDAATGLAHQVPMVVVADRVIGFRDADMDQLRRWMFDGSRIMGGLMTLGEMAEFATSAAALAPWTDAQLDAALMSPTTGVLGAAAAAVRDGGLTREQAAFTLMVLLGAGAETTTSLIGTAVAILADMPSVQEVLRADPTGIPAFVEEVLRFESPFLYHPRTAASPTHLGGVDIPQDALVVLLWASANRDDEVFPDADRFDPTRPNTHLHFGFGRGIHHCVGAPLARLEARVVIDRLLARTTAIEPDRARERRWADSIWIRRLEELPVVLTPRGD